MLVCLWFHLGNPTCFLIFRVDCLSVSHVQIIFFSRILPAFLMYIHPLPPVPILQTLLKVIKCMHFTNREYFPMSQVLLRLEITFAVINKIHFHSFGAHNWVSWIHLGIFVYPSLLKSHCTTLNPILYSCQVLYCVFSSRKTVYYLKQTICII